ncbi:MAG: tetratricopeptide repeat protein, partial [bacterium]
LNVFAPQQDYEDAKRWRALENFIDAMAKETRTQGLPLMLVTVPSNLWVEPRMNQGQEYNFAPVYLEARYEYALGRRKEAIARLTQAVATRPSALWHFTLGVWFYRENAWQKAYEQLILAQDLDPARMRASTAVNSLIRHAAIRNNTMLLDADQIIKNQAPHGIPGWENFMDSQHVTRPDFLELAHLCALRLMDAGWSGLASKTYRSYPPTPPVYQNIADAFFVVPRSNPSGWRSFSYFVECHLPYLTAHADALFIHAFPNPQKRSAAFLGLAEALWRKGRHDEARAANKKARRIFSGWADPYVQVGLFDIRENRHQAALEDFRQALKKKLGDPRAIFFARRIEGTPYSSLRSGNSGDKLA